MEDQSHIFQLLFQETAEHQISEYKSSNLIDDLLTPSEGFKSDTNPSSQAAIDFLFDETDNDWTKSIENAEGSDETSSNSTSSKLTSSPSTTITGFIDETEETEEAVPTISFSCNGTSELPRHIQDVRERVKRELGVKTNLNLTDEERRLLREEGVDLPEDLPLTKAEERVLKKVRRKIRNKRSAMESRRRKKEHFSNVEGELTSCKDENDELKKRVMFLEKQNFNLMAQLRRLQESVMAIPKSGHACALSVMIFSLFVFCYPGGSGPLTFDSLNSDQPIIAPIPIHKSRKILQAINYEESNETVKSGVNLTDKFVGYDPLPEEIPEVLKDAEIVSGSHRSLMPESPEEYLKNVQTISRQGEM